VDTVVVPRFHVFKYGHRTVEHLMDDTVWFYIEQLCFKNERTTIPTRMKILHGYGCPIRGYHTRMYMVWIYF
jgi:hypothetical protein